MDKARIILILAILAAAVSGCGVDPCRNEPPFTLDGRVEDGDGTPVGGVTVYGYIDPKEMGLPLADIPDPQPSCSTSTDDCGRYRLSFGCDAEEFVVVPAREGCVFSPANSFWRPGYPLEDHDFDIYCGEGHVADGYVWAPEGPGHPVGGITVRIQSMDASRWGYTVTDVDGYYTFFDLYPAFVYDIAPYHPCLEFEPESRTIEHPAEDYHNQDFKVTSAEFVYIRGYVRDPYGAPVEGVTLTGTYIVPYGDPTTQPGPPLLETQIEVTTDEHGFYQIHTPTCASVTVQPYRLGCHAVPHMRSCAPRHDLDDQDYTLFCGEGHSISGYLKDGQANPVAHAEVCISATSFGWYKSETDAEGYYEMINLPWGLDYLVEPARCSGYMSPCTCDPPWRGYENLDRDYVDQDFEMTCIY